jgi:dolichyl-diphosphooligosaccharide--protein glycosyltransferase/undecaprenyl-diphosphooligosaccharide--protein glycosyltransferase
MFSNLNLQTGNKERTIYFFPTQIRKQSSSKLYLANGITLDITKGSAKIGKNDVKLTSLDVVTLDKNNNTHVESHGYHFDGRMSVVFLKSYNKIIIMDNQTYNSAYVQMFMLGKYDKNLFELVVKSPYTKIYRVKK